MKRFGIYFLIGIVLAFAKPIGPGNSHAAFWEEVIGQFLGSLVLVAIIGGIISAIASRNKQRKAEKTN